MLLLFEARIINMLKLRKAQLLIENKALLLEEEVKKATLTRSEHRSFTNARKSI